MTKALFSSKKQNWTTLQWLFDQLNEEFDFTLDAAASDDKAVEFWNRRDGNKE